MDQIHRCFSTDHVRNLLRGCTDSLPERPAIEEVQMDRQTVELRVWWKATIVQSVVYPFKAFPRVHL